MVENVADIMMSCLTSESLAAARDVGAAAESADVLPFLVGGSVRDALMGRETIVDLDIALVGADSKAFSRIAEFTCGQISRRSQFMTAKLQLDSLEIDLAMARAEEYPESGSLPAVRTGTLEEDLARRDFSVNSMAVSLSSENWGDLVDVHDGLLDLKRRRLRVLHEDSFTDDPTRILRAARYSSRLTLTPTAETLDSLLKSVRFLDRVSPARVRNELERVFLERDVSGAMRHLSNWGVLAAIHTSLHFRRGPWCRFNAEVEGMSPNRKISLGYAILSCDISEGDVTGLVRRLNPGSSAGRSMQEASLLGRIAANDVKDYSNSDLARVLDPLSGPAVLGVALAGGGELGCRFSEYLSCHRDLSLHLTGDDLIAMGVPRGPSVGSILQRLRNAWLDGEVCSSSDERSLAERLVKELTKG